jgi:hypothetical protein
MFRSGEIPIGPQLDWITRICTDHNRYSVRTPVHANSAEWQPRQPDHTEYLCISVAIRVHLCLTFLLSFQYHCHSCVYFRLAQFPRSHFHKDQRWPCPTLTLQAATRGNRIVSWHDPVIGAATASPRSFRRSCAPETRRSARSLHPRRFGQCQAGGRHRAIQMNPTHRRNVPAE